MSHTQLRRGTKTPIVPWWHTVHRNTEWATEKDISVVYSVWAGWCLAILPPRAWKKNPSCSPQTKITILITMVVLWSSHSAAGRTRLRWHRPLGMGTRSGPASREITGWCGGRRGESWSLPPLPAVSLESYCLQLASSSLFHLGPLEIIGDVLCVNMFFFFSLEVKFHCFSLEDLCFWPACRKKNWIFSFLF